MNAPASPTPSSNPARLGVLPTPAPRPPAGWTGKLAIVCVGLMAGIFFAFAVAVMPGLARTEDRVFVGAMQAVNRAIENAPFGLTFLGALVLPGAAAILQHRGGAVNAARWSLASVALYVVALGITFGVNIPLNQMLAGVSLDDAAALAKARTEFEGPWNTANAARTIAATLALACLAKARSRH